MKIISKESGTIYDGKLIIALPVKNKGNGF